MPRKPSPLKVNRRQLRQAAADGSELLAQAAEVWLDRWQSHIVTGASAPRRPRGRGSQLPPVVQIGLMHVAAVWGLGPRRLAQATGMHRRTIQRLLRTPQYQEHRQQVARGALNLLLGRRGRWRP